MSAVVSAVVGAGSSLISGYLQSESAEDATHAQKQSSDAALNEQRRQFDLSRTDSAPYRQAGNAATNQLGYLMGLPGYQQSSSGPQQGSYSQQPALTAPNKESFYSRPVISPRNPGSKFGSRNRDARRLEAENPRTFDQAGYDKAMATYNSANNGVGNVYRAPSVDFLRGNAPLDDWGMPIWGTSTSGSPTSGYGSLSRNFSANDLKNDPLLQSSEIMRANAELGPSASSSLNSKFSIADFMDDPITKLSYQSGLDQGTQAISRMAGAAGSRDSGATLKELSRFGTDYTGQQAGASRSRYLEDQGNLLNRLQYGDTQRAGASDRFNTNRTNRYNQLAGISGTGQVAQSNQSQLGQASSQNIGNIMTAQGNAAGAGAIAQGNAWGGAVRNIGDWYNSNNQLNRMINSRGNGAVNVGYNNGNYATDNYGMPTNGWGRDGNPIQNRR